MGTRKRRIKAWVKPAYCNLCGGELNAMDVQNDFEIHRNVGYGSRYDLTEVRLCLCNNCFDRLADACVLTPVERNYE